MKPETISSRNQLGCNEGIEGAIEALADEGVAGVRVESLAKRFSVTKGKLLLALQGPPGSVQRHIANLERRTLRDWAKRDAQAGAVVEEVDIYQLESARKLFIASGLADNEAKKRSFLLYAYIFGQSLMACGRYDSNISAIKRQIAKHIVNNPIDSRST